jgi:SAM-dependent methyltransferase
MMARSRYDFTRDPQLAEDYSVSAPRVAPKILDIHPARSVVDVGCNIGVWLRAFLDHGVERVLGIDGDYVDTAKLVVDPALFVRRDLNRPLGDIGRFDLAISLEVGEHLEPGRAKSFVADLCKLADVVLYGAAVPFQGGELHVNEQWQSYWAQHFADHGYLAYDVLRRAIWAQPNVAYWYKQNTIFYVKAGSPAQATFRARYGEPSATMFDVVHPELFRGKVWRLKNGNVVNRLLNRFRTSGGRPRGAVLSHHLNGDDHFQHSSKSKLAEAPDALSLKPR